MFKQLTLFFIFSISLYSNISYGADLEDKDINLLITYLRKDMDAACELGTLNGERKKISWSENDLKNKIRFYFSPRLMKEALAFFREMGGDNYTNKRYKIWKEMRSIIKSLSIKTSKTKINKSYHKILEKDFNVLMYKGIFECFYLRKNIRKSNLFKKAETFGNNAVDYMIRIISMELTKEEYMKEKTFYKSPVGRVLRSVVEATLYNISPSPRKKFYT